METLTVRWSQQEQMKIFQVHKTMDDNSIITKQGHGGGGRYSYFWDLSHKIKLLCKWNSNSYYNWQGLGKVQDCSFHTSQDTLGFTSHKLWALTFSMTDFKFRHSISHQGYPATFTFLIACHKPYEVPSFLFLCPELTDLFQMQHGTKTEGGKGVSDTILYVICT